MTVSVFIPFSMSEEAEAKYTSSKNGSFFCFRIFELRLRGRTLWQLYFCRLSVPFFPNKHNRLFSSHKQPYAYTRTRAGCVPSIKRIYAQPTICRKAEDVCSPSLLRSGCSPSVHSHYLTRWCWVSLSPLPVVVSQHLAAPPQLKAADSIQCIYHFLLSWSVCVCKSIYREWASPSIYAC